MPFIMFCERFPIVDILPAMKGVYFTDNLRLLFYAKAAYIPDYGFLFDLMKFERNPVVNSISRFSEHDSIMVVSFNYTGNEKDPAVTVKLNANGLNEVFVDEIKDTSLTEVSTYKGYDEQGWYWGVRYLLSKGFLNDIYGKISLATGSVIQGNIYAKLVDNLYEHFVAIAPFTDQNILNRQNYTDFQLLL